MKLQFQFNNQNIKLTAVLKSLYFKASESEHLNKSYIALLISKITVHNIHNSNTIND
jgi:hypothetical protein